MLKHANFALSVTGCPSRKEAGDLQPCGEEFNPMIRGEVLGAHTEAVAALGEEV